MKAVSQRRDAFNLAETDREWLRRKWAIIREAHQEADKAIRKWRRLSDEVNDYLDRSGVTDIVQRAKIRSENLGLKDALGAGEWWRNEARAHSDDIQLFLRLKEMGLL